MQKSIHRLIKASIKGDQSALMQIYDMYCQAMYTIACRYLKNEEDAKDVMQEGFLKAFLNLKNYKETATFGAWLKRIIINQCIDRLKKKQFEAESLEAENMQVVDDNDWQFEASITKADIIKEINLLPEKYKLVIMLYLIEGYDHQEIAQILNIEIKTSRTQLRRAKLQLQDRLKPKYNGTTRY